MCMEDVLLGRAKRASVTLTVPPNNASTPILGFNPLRTHITFATNNAQWFLCPAPGDASLNGNFQINSTLPPLEFDIETHGDLVTKPWNGYCTQLGGALTIVEVTLERLK